MKSSIQGFIGCESSWDEARAVIFGAPFDSTTSFRPGARFGPAAMRSESFGIETYSPYQDKDLEELKIFDAGDIELPFGNAAAALGAIEEAADEILDAGKVPVLLGGEHLVTLGAVRAAAKKYPDLHIVHFDAHADLREDYLGEKLSHASVIRRCWDILGDGRIFQFAIRSGSREEMYWSRAHTTMEKFRADTIEEAVRAIGGAPLQTHGNRWRKGALQAVRRSRVTVRIVDSKLPCPPAFLTSWLKDLLDIQEEPCYDTFGDENASFFPANALLHACKKDGTLCGAKCAGIAPVSHRP